MKKISVNIIIYYLFLLSCFFPFVSPIPINTDVQPLVIIFGVLILIINYTKLIKNKKNFFYIFFILISLIYVNPFYLYDIVSVYEYKKVFALVGAIFILLAFPYSLKYLTKNFFNIVVLIYFIMTILILLNPDLFLDLQGHIVREVNSKNIYGSRGIGTFATEPGLFAGMMIGFLLVNDYLLAFNHLNKKNYLFNMLLIIIMILLSKSGTGYLLLLLYFTLKFFQNIKLNLKNVIIISIVIIGFSYIINFLLNLNVNNRGIEILKYLFENPMFYMQHDLSIYTRVYSVMTGLYSLVEYPFGFGVFNIENFLYHNVIMKHVVLYSFPKLELSNSIFIVSGFTFLIAMYGIIGLMFIVYVWMFYSKSKFINKFFAMIYMLASYSVLFPFIWILLNLPKEKK